MIKVIGVGNTLFGDDGIGFYLASALRECSRTSAQIEAMETLDYTSVSLLEKTDVAIFIDGSPPGALAEPRLLLLEKDSLREALAGGSPEAVDPHDLSPAQLAYVGYTIGVFSGRAFLLIVPTKRIDLGFGIAEETAEKSKQALDILEKLLKSLGAYFEADRECFFGSLRSKIVSYDSSA